MIISIEGNIGSGKSTLLNLLKEKFTDVIFIDEPVSEWNEIKDNDKSILDLFYEDKSKYSFTFQVLAYITRLKKILDVLKNNPDKLIVCERSILTDKYVFAKMLYQQGYINEIEWKTYNYWFDTFKEEFKLHLIIYVKTDPDVCLSRVKKRNRGSETDIPLDYLKHCHNLHEEWINECEDSKVINFDGNLELTESNESQYLNYIQKFFLNFNNEQNV